MMPQREHRARDSEKLHGARQGKGVRGDDADIGLHIDKAVRIEVLRVNDGRVDIGKDLELIGTAHIVAVAGGAVGDDALTVHVAYLTRLKRLDHPLVLRHTTDPLVGFNAHLLPIPTEIVINRPKKWRPSIGEPPLYRCVVGASCPDTPY